LAPEPDEQTIAVFEQGHEVGHWAQKKFPGGVLIKAGPEELRRALRQTERAVEDKHPAIFEATFSHGNILARVDILQRLPRNKWRLIEVKSANSIKDYHLYDVAIQQHILESLGMKVVPCLMHLNRDYVYDGKQYDLKRLFVMQEVTDETAALKLEVNDLIREERKVLARAKPPDIEPGSHCTRPCCCEFYDVCNKPLPVDDVANLPGITAKKLAELATWGIQSIRKIPKTFDLNDRQRHAWESAKTGKPWFGKGLKKALSELRYPLYFMDFETLGVPLPRYAGTSPYGQIPFQWSVHVQQKPGAEPEHYEFLADDSNDPRPEFIRTLCEVVGKRGSVLAYCSGFESSCLDGLAEAVPRYKKQIRDIQRRLWDPLPVIREHVYDLAFRGSYSLKSVLPALVPEMSYEGMEVSEGSEAGLVWEKMLQSEAGSEERRRLRAALLAYCKQDTLGMVRLIDLLRSI
jgi:CRISPR/Cas system-associated exonuclease Cas4 (RecB family)